MTQLYIIDASGYLHSAYHAIMGMTNSKGESTNALFGFINSYMKLCKDFNPEYIVAIFDGPNNAKKRKELYPDYKANRKSMAEDLRYQITWARDFCELMGIPMLNIPEVEADDTMGSVANWAEHHFSDVYLCTSDKDMAQLVNDHVKILNTRKENLIIGPKEVEEIYGVKPEQIVDYLAITGDASDNIPGLPGFGPKTAVSLIQEFHSLENILDNPESVSGKKKQETIINERDKALISKQLVTIDTSVEVPAEKDFYKHKEVNVEELKQLYETMGFNKFLRELDQIAKPNQGAEETVYTLVDDENSFKALLELLSKQKEICFDTETTALNPMEAELVGIGFGIEAKKAWYIPTNGTLGLDRVLSGVKPLFENSKIGFFGHNVKYDYQVLLNYGIRASNICFDTILASYILNSQSRRHSLDILSLELFGKTKIPTSDLIGKGKNQITMREVPIQTVSNYCCEDVDYTFRLKELFYPQLAERKLSKLYYDLELPLIKVLARMERNGIYLDVPCLEEMGHEVIKQIDTLAEEIYTLAGERFNINSPKQLSAILFEKMGIKPPKGPAKNAGSTNVDVLEFLELEHPIATKLMEYRTLEKLRSTYIDSLPHMVNPKTHRIHTTFNQVVAATGRLSSQDPNLQNIPIRSEAGRKIRRAFRPEKKGWSYLAADYSQIELRLLAHFSGDPNMIHAFQQGEDIHAHTAATIFGIPLDQVTKEMRYRAKAVNFGVIYGQQAFGLSRELKISQKEAKDFIETYFKQFPYVKNYTEECVEKAQKSLKAVTYTGRERAIPEITSKNPQLRAAAERLAVNTPLQGSAADLIKAAMLKIDSLLQKEGYLGYMILQIHDELIFELPDFEVPAIELIVKQTMEGVLKLKVPLIVNIEVGKNWEEC